MTGRASSTTTVRKLPVMTSANLASYNVLGWYARHIFFLDEKDPEIYQEQSVTGFYGINDDKKPVVNRSGVLVAFDSAVDADTVGVDTFEVKNGDASATVTDVTVEGRQVYLLLGGGAGVGCYAVGSDRCRTVGLRPGWQPLDARRPSRVQGEGRHRTRCSR